MSTVIINCSCNTEHEQNKTLGKGKRYANSTEKVVGEKKVYRCTVCLKESTK